MISVDEALARIVSAFSETESEFIPLEKASGRVLGEQVRARLDQPPAAISAMDGYAVRSADVSLPQATLRVIGTAPAGHPFTGVVRAGEAVRIFTGGVVPDGADAIVIQENATRNGDEVRFSGPAIAGKHIRRAALDFARNDILAEKGRKLRARDLALLAAGDVASVCVRKPPVVAFAATGDELSLPGQARRAGGIVASSGYALASMIETWGARPRDLGILSDTIEAFRDLPENARDADIIVTMGGASVGDHDLVREALAPKGFELDFWKIAMRPGKPLIFGKLITTPFLGLPGNPVSSLVCAILFLKPAIKTMLGERQKDAIRAARLLAQMPANDSRQDYLRARLEFRDGSWWAEPFSIQDSSMQRLFVSADALIARAPYAPAAAIGDFVEILPLDEI